jgi:uncharacterized protein YcbK (DUF882 family)
MRNVTPGRVAALATSALLLIAHSAKSSAIDNLPTIPSATAPMAVSGAPAKTEVPSALALTSSGTAPVTAAMGTPYHLRLHHLHTGESIDVVYRIGNTYIPGALDRLNHFLRDHRTQDVSTYDPKEFDVLHSLMASLGRPDGVIDIVCGYRTPWSNNFLRTRTATTGVAEHSQHMLAKAIDIRVPGISTMMLRNAALALRAGGVGYYPVSQFVHVDVGPVRTWQYGR